MIKEVFFNDLQLVGTYGFLFGFALVVILLAIYFHELGHWIYFKAKLKKDIKIRFQFDSIWSFKWRAGTIEDYKGLTLQQYKTANMFGVLCGFLPIIASGFVIPLFLFISIPYLIGCKSDLKEIKNVSDIEEKESN